MSKAIYKILLVEDEQLMREMMFDRFSRETQFQMITANNGQEGLESALANKPDLILLDVNMPVMDGIKMSQELYKHPGTEDIKIIFLTNFDTDENVLKEISKNKPAYYLIKVNTNLEEIIQKTKEALGIINIL